MAIDPPGPRQVRLVLVAGDGPPLGVLPPFEVAIPWWQEAWPVVDGARERFGVELTILRLLHVGGATVHGGDVTYLAEVAPGPVVANLPLEPWAEPLRDDPHRMAWARPGGPAADVRWADEVLAGHGLTRVGPARQVRTWNLSSLWNLSLADGSSAWLKAVPAFFAHEGPVIAYLAGRTVPALLGRDGPRILMPELPGDDQHDATRPALDRMIDALVTIQADEADAVEPLLRLGLPDWRGPALTTAIQRLIDRRSPELDPTDRDTLRSFADGLPTRFVAIDTCGLPDTLVHGDFHPGNVRGAGERLVLLDWGDCGVGHPLLDEPAFLRTRPSLVEALRAHWHARWHERRPGSDPVRAARLLAPVAAARQALIYQRFLDGIEPSEWPYHQHDVPEWLQRTATQVRSEPADLLR